MERLSKYMFTAIAFLTINTSISLADENNSYAGSNSSFSVGASYIGSDSVYVDGKSTSRLIPYVAYKLDRLNVSLQEGLSYELIDRSKYSFSFSLKPNFQPYRSSDSSVFDGMKRELTFDSSLSLSYEIARGLSTKLRISSEVTNKFNGHMADIEVSQFIPILPIPIILNVGADWYDRKRSQYIYGVYNQEVKEQRPYFEPGAVILASASINSFYKLDSRTSLFVNIAKKILPPKVTSSPLVDKKSSTALIIGLGYKF